MSAIIDHLKEDPPIHDQKFVLCSFLFPEELYGDKHAFFISEFWRMLKQSELMEEIQTIDLGEEYKKFIEKNILKLEEVFMEKSNNCNTIRGLKVRGSYATKEECNERAQMLLKDDPNHNIFTCSVGCWLPLELSATQNVQNPVYMNEKLNELVKGYEQNAESREQFYREEVENRKRAMEMENEVKRLRQKEQEQEEEVPEELTAHV